MYNVHDMERSKFCGGPSIPRFYNSVAVCAVAIRRTSERNKNIEKMNLMKENFRLNKMGKVLNCGGLGN